MLERRDLEVLLDALKVTRLAPHLILVGSAALYLLPTSVPPLTVDVDLVVDTSILRKEAAAFMKELQELGFQHVEGAPTFIHKAGWMVDLLGREDSSRGDHVADCGPVSVFVFDDLCRLTAESQNLEEHGGWKVLGAAALIFSKLRTVRLDKGNKDKLQALAVLGESTSPVLPERLQTLAKQVGTEEWEDVVADAQAAFLSLGAASHDDYGAFLATVERGYKLLTALTGPA